MFILRRARNVLEYAWCFTQSDASYNIDASSAYVMKQIYDYHFLKV